MTGAEIEAYLNALQYTRREPPEWSGFRVRRVASPSGGEVYRSDLEPARRYRVVMARLEWESWFRRLAGETRKPNPHPAAAARDLVATPAGVSFTTALLASIRPTLAEGVSLQDRARDLARQRESPP